MTDNSGYIYVLTNPSFPEFIKIGYADNVDTRVSQLNRSECTPFAFKKYAVLHVASRLADKNVHKLIDKLKPELRAKENVNGKMRIREFFAMSAKEAVEILEAIGSIYGETPQIFEQTDEEKQEQAFVEKTASDAERKSPFSFYKCGIKNGDIITYAHDPNIICTVIGDRLIEYAGKQTSLSALAQNLLGRKFGVQGTLYFMFKGEVLSALRKRLEDEGKYNNCGTEVHADTPYETTELNRENEMLLAFSSKKYYATCKWNNKGFLLLKGSEISPTIGKSCSNTIRQLREEYKKSINNRFILTEDILFTSSSAAAEFVTGCSVNGKVCWKNEEGVLLKYLTKSK